MVLGAVLVLVLGAVLVACRPYCRRLAELAARRVSQILSPAGGFAWDESMIWLQWWW